VLYRTEQLVFVQFRTVDWPGYKDFSNYARVARERSAGLQGDSLLWMANTSGKGD